MGPVKGDRWWRTKWIPITSDGGGNNHCIDLDPDEGGTPGQIITMWHDEGSRECIASSFREWFANIVTKLENGDYGLEKKKNFVLFNSYGFLD
ncbi:SMI1/KNR4 family protein [Thermoflavimicrobium dichotomicum]|uniref:SMI1/KNR4 family protein n=1 Tax=Thermoflavimicrobium dichotomicum TaxID=46223 RepID=UPI000B87FBB2|nr:SMI1/KNR4 family protein [Thermoflavimicrobium dichotomicum]